MRRQRGEAEANVNKSIRWCEQNKEPQSPSLDLKKKTHTHQRGAIMAPKGPLFPRWLHKRKSLHFGACSGPGAAAAAVKAPIGFDGSWFDMEHVKSWAIATDRNAGWLTWHHVTDGHQERVLQAGEVTQQLPLKHAVPVPDGIVLKRHERPLRPTAAGQHLAGKPCRLGSIPTGTKK